MKMFYERELSGFLESLRAGLKNAVHAETAEYLFNVNVDEYSRHLLERFSIKPLAINFDSANLSTREERIRAERFPSQSFFVEPGQSYPKQVVRYYIPYEGTEELLHCVPNPRMMWTHEVELKENCICFDIVDFYGDANRIKQEAGQIIDNIRKQADNVAQNVKQYNDQLPGLISKTISERKEQLQKQIGVVAALGLPIRKSASFPNTFRVPDVRKKLTPKPTVPTGTGIPEPALGDDLYQEILQVIHDTGKVFERLPNTYADKDEEALRDHLILQLEPRFEGSTTGETFNKSGKTDILVRYEKSNIFVAECYWWDGQKKHQEKIDQLLSYLTWRDSKTAVIVFVNRKDFTNVLKEIESTTKMHPCYVSFLSKKEDTWFNFEFRLPSDQGRKVKVAVLGFHLPAMVRT